MTIFRYSAQSAAYDRGALFPLLMAGLLGLWALIAIAIASSPKLAAIEEDHRAAGSYVSCQPAGAEAIGTPGQLLRCTVERNVTPAKEI